MTTSIEHPGPRDTWSPELAKPLDEALWQVWVAKGRAQDRRSSAARMKAVKWVSIAGLLAAALWSGALSAGASTGDLSRYRDFQLGTSLSTVAKQVGADPSQAKIIHRRPALIQELEWRPQPMGPSSRTEPAKDVAFSFYDGELFRIVVNYDRYETEGMTGDDFVQAISSTYGIAVKPTAPAKAAQGRYHDEEVVLAQWQDSQHSFELIRSSYGPTFKLVGVLKKLQASAQAAVIEAARLDDIEAPQREAQRLATDDETQRAKLEKARLLNKPKFRP